MKNIDLGAKVSGSNLNNASFKFALSNSSPMKWENTSIYPSELLEDYVTHKTSIDVLWVLAALLLTMTSHHSHPYRGQLE